MDDRESRYEFGQTHWSLVFAAGKKMGTAATARQDLLIRYHEAVYRYLCDRLHDPHAAGELFSRFAERVLEIHPFLERADPERGRFRDYLRSVLQRMVIDYHREQQRLHKHRRGFAEGGDAEPVAPEPTDLDDEAFRNVWVDELMNRAWQGLQAAERQGGQPYHTLLLFKVDQPKMRSDAIAQHFSNSLGRPFTAANVRQLLHRGQAMLSDLLVQEVARTLQGQDGKSVAADQIEDELLQLQLLDKPRKEAVARYRAQRLP